MDSAKPLPFYAEIARPACEAHGIRMIVEPIRRKAVQLVYPNGAVRFLYTSRYDLDTVATGDMAKVKAWSLNFLRQSGISIPEYDFFFEDRWAERCGTSKNEAAAIAYADRLGYPVVIKPCSKSQGKGVHVIPSREDLLRTLPLVTAIESMFLIQRMVLGREFRVVVVDGVVHLAYQKSPMRLTGDGRRTVRELLEAVFSHMRAAGRETTSTCEDMRYVSFLKAQGLTLESVPDAGQQVQPGLTAGFHSGGSLTEAIDWFPDWARRVAVDVARLAGMRLCGMDMVLLDTPSGEPSYAILEVNSSPFLNGYASIGGEQLERVKALSATLIHTMGQDPPPPPGHAAWGALAMQPAGPWTGQRSLAYIPGLFERFAAKHGVAFVAEPQFGAAVRLLYPNGVIRYLRGPLLDINHSTATKMATSRRMGYWVLDEAGLPVPDYHPYTRGPWPKERRPETVKGLLRFASDVGYPLILRDETSRGRGVRVVHSEEELVSDLRRRQRHSQHILQQLVPGRHRSLVVFDGRVEFLRTTESGESTHPESVALALRELAILAVQCSGLRFAAVNLRATDDLQCVHLLDIEPDPHLEGLSKVSDEANRLVEDLYERIFLAMGQMPTVSRA